MAHSGLATSIKNEPFMTTLISRSRGTCLIGKHNMPATFLSHIEACAERRHMSSAQDVTVFPAPAAASGGVHPAFAFCGD